MRFMFQYPETAGTDTEMLDAGPVADLAKAAEAAGFEGFAFTEHPAPGARWLETGGHPTLDPFVALGHVAAVTTRLTLLTYLTVLPYRNPMLVAKAASTVDVLSGGRFVLGAGAGYLKGEFRALGVDFEERNALFDEALEVLALHWAGEPFSYRGRHFEAREVVARPRPVGRTIPIWVGGNSALARRRVVERAEGWMPMTGPAELFATTRTAAIVDVAELAAAIAALRSAAGERGPSLDVAVAYPDRSVADLDREVERHREAFGRLESSGVTWVVIPGSTTSRQQSLEFIEGFGATFGLL
jgi:probable F420-dependent oxidoreductase